MRNCLKYFIIVAGFCRVQAYYNSFAQTSCKADYLSRDINHPGINFSTPVASSYLWNFGDGDTSLQQNPLHSYSDTGTYNVNVTVTDTSGSTYQCTLTVKIYPVWEFNVPNAFIPDPSGPNGGFYSYDNIKNDIFFPVVRYVKEYRLEIFNRGGVLIFDTFDVKQGWDGYSRGKLCKQDVYVWKIHLIFADGKNTEINQAGEVTLIR